MTTYTTREGDRWDTISQAVYGRPDMYSKIWTANEDACDALGYCPTVPGGITLAIPELTDNERYAQTEVPPWRR